MADIFPFPETACSCILSEMLLYEAEVSYFLQEM